MWLLHHMLNVPESYGYSIIILGFTITALSLLYHVFPFRNGYADEKRLKSIPGPPRNLIGGNEGQFSPLSPYLTFQKWAEEYGAIFEVKVGTQRIISVNDPRMAKTLFEKRGAKFSSRQSPHVGSELLSQGRRIAFIPSGPMHTAFRRQMHGVLSIARTKENHKIQELESRQLLHEVLDWSHTQFSSDTSNFQDIQQIYRRYTLSVMMTLGFGQRIKSLHSKIVDKVFDIMNDIAKTIQPGQYLVDIFPLLKKLPYFLRTWEHETNRKLAWQWPFLKDLLDRTESQMAGGIANPGLVRSLMEQRRNMTDRERHENFLDDKCIAYQAMTLLEAGADTTAITVMNFTLAMVQNPSEMKKGQEAVDAVVDENRLPTFEDISRMPYINQIVKEVMRWRPVINMGIPHSNEAEDEIDGYYIHKDSIIFGNIWAMQHDLTHYANPEAFMPERYESSKTKTAFESSMEADAMNRDHYIFGWGRRICPGLHLAEGSVLLLAARLLWAFDITAAKDVHGAALPVTSDPATAYENSIISNPKVFPVAFKPRSKKREQAIRHAYQDALTLWEDMQFDLFID